MKYFNYHTPTLYCDGKDIPETFIREAIYRKMSAIGFPSHSPFNNNYSIKGNRVDDYKRVSCYTKTFTLQKFALSDMNLYFITLIFAYL